MVSLDRGFNVPDGPAATDRESKAAAVAGTDPRLKPWTSVGRRHG